ncbi:MAG: hypothetical protein CMN85_04285 [Spongiibacteraceae bacterium]|nr:hypothetical protein [Spongiibacteraceae bacterium]
MVWVLAMLARLNRSILQSCKFLWLLGKLPAIRRAVCDLSMSGSERGQLQSDVGIYTFTLMQSELLRERRGLAGDNEIFFVPVTRENLYSLTASLLEEFRVVPVLEFCPDGINERLQVHNLYHQAYSLRKTVFAHGYFEKIAELVATNRQPFPVPNIVSYLGMAALIPIFKDALLRAALKVDWWAKVARLRANIVIKPAAADGDTPVVKRVLITGWYGTETAGDKAILMELIDELTERYGSCDIHITSIVPSYSQLSNDELGIQATVHDLKNLPYERFGALDLVAFGGGPIMDSSQLQYISILFGWAKRRGVRTLLFGCGVGPLRKLDNVAFARQILESSDSAFFRDDESAQQAEELGYAGEKLIAADPGLRYAYRWKRRHQGSPERKGLVAMLRAQTVEYSSAASGEQDRLSQVFSGFLTKLVERRDVNSISLVAMHSFWLGNDDRVYNSRIALPVSSCLSEYPISAPQTLEEILQAAVCAKFGMPMRFHGHIFLLAMGVPFIGVDYTGPGAKVGSLIRRYGLEDYEVAADENMSVVALLECWESLVSNYEGVVNHIEKKLVVDIQALEMAYARAFHETTSGAAQ